MSSGEERQRPSLTGVPPDIRMCIFDKLATHKLMNATGEETIVCSLSESMPLACKPLHRDYMKYRKGEHPLKFFFDSDVDSMQSTILSCVEEWKRPGTTANPFGQCPSGFGLPEKFEAFIKSPKNLIDTLVIPTGLPVSFTPGSTAQADLDRHFRATRITLDELKYWAHMQSLQPTSERKTFLPNLRRITIVSQIPSVWLAGETDLWDGYGGRSPSNPWNRLEPAAAALAFALQDLRSDSSAERIECTRSDQPTFPFVKIQT